MEEHRGALDEALYKPERANDIEQERLGETEGQPAKPLVRASVVDVACDELLWDFERSIKWESGSEKRGADERLILNNLAVHLQAIHASNSFGFVALISFEDFLIEEAARHRREKNETGRMVFENTLAELKTMAGQHRTKDVALPAWECYKKDAVRLKEGESATNATALAEKLNRLKEESDKRAEALAGEDELHLEDMLFLFGKETAMDFYAPDYYEIDNNGIREKSLNDDEIKSRHRDYLKIWREIKERHRLAFPCTPCGLLEWCNCFDHNGMQWEILLHGAFVMAVRQGMAEAGQSEEKKAIEPPELKPVGEYETSHYQPDLTAKELEAFKKLMDAENDRHKSIEIGKLRRAFIFFRHTELVTNKGLSVGESHLLIAKEETKRRGEDSGVDAIRGLIRRYKDEHGLIKKK